MINALMFVNSRGDVVGSRIFRDGYNVRYFAENFRNSLISTNLVERCPINILDNFCYVHVRFHDLYLILVSDGNVNCFACFQYALQLLAIFYEYFGAFDEETLKTNFVVLQHLIDESIDFGYPQVTEAPFLRKIVNESGIDVGLMKKPLDAGRVTTKVTEGTSWRDKGVWHVANQLFVDVMEELHVLISHVGEVLESNAVGRVMVKNFLCGMPECQLVLGNNFPLENLFCHPCVFLLADRTFGFVPPDGSFLLLRYRTVLRSPPPLKLLHTRFKEISKTHTEVEFGLKCDIDEGKVCSDVEIHIPCPENTADVKIRVIKGVAQFDGVQHALIWKLPKVSQKDTELLLAAEIILLAPTLTTAEQMWSRPPVKIRFTTPSYALSGFCVKDIKVEEPLLKYKAASWVRYATTAGQYEQRI